MLGSIREAMAHHHRSYVITCHGDWWVFLCTNVLAELTQYRPHVVAEIFQGIAWLHSRDSLAASISQNTWYIIFLSASVFTNIFCTVSIIYRIITLSGYAKALKTYHGILEILVESALLYTVIYLIQIGLRVYGTYFASRWDPRFLYGQSLTNVITVCVSSSTILNSILLLLPGNRSNSHHRTRSSRPRPSK